MNNLASGKCAVNFCDGVATDVVFRPLKPRGVFMTEDELRDEFLYRVTERFGIMCVTDEPTEDQRVIAVEEAKQACEELRQQ
jgi:hypothetical protein